MSKVTSNIMLSIRNQFIIQKVFNKFLIIVIDLFDNNCTLDFLTNILERNEPILLHPDQFITVGTSSALNAQKKSSHILELLILSETGADWSVQNELG